MDSKAEPTIQHMDNVSAQSSEHEKPAAAIDHEQQDIHAFEERPLDGRTLLALLVSLCEITVHQDCEELALTEKFRL